MENFASKQEAGMTRDDIIRMAREAGWSRIYCVKPFLSIKLTEDELTRFAALVAAKEREACAELCQEMEDRENPYERNVAVLDCASAIRARGE